MNKRYCAAVALVLLCHVPLAFAAFNASTLQALHVVDAKRYETYLRECSYCFIGDKGLTSDRIVANTKERLPDMRKMLPRLANQTILFAGDSVIQIQYYAFAALIWEADKSSIYSKGTIRSSRWNFTLLNVYVPHLLDVDSNGLRGDLSKKELHHSISSILSQDQPPEILFLSTFHHWSQGKYMKSVPPDQNGKADLKVLRAGVTRVNELLKPFSNRTRIIWRAAPARHFVNGEWNSGGRCNRTVPYTKEELVYQMAYGNSFTHFDVLLPSALIREEAEASGYEFVDILPYSVPRPDGVVGSLHPSKGVVDCSHYCVPGVPDVWNTVFLENILSTIPVT